MSRFFASFRSSASGTAAAEMALMLPMLAVLMFGGMETAHFFWTEHTLIKNVRDGARFAGRQGFDKFDCDAGAIDAGVVSSVQALTRTGFVDGDDPDTDGADNPLVRGWGDNTTVSVELECVDGDTFSSSGIYRDATGTGTSEVVAMRVVVTADVAYPSLFEGFGFLEGRVLTASAQSPVMGF